MNDEYSWGDRAIRRFCVLLAAVVALLLATELAARAALVPHLSPLSIHALLTNPLFAIGFGCPLVLQLSSWPRLREVVETAILAVVLFFPLAATAGAFTAVQGVIAAGVSSAAILATRAFSGDEQERRRALLFLLPSLVALIFTLEVAMFLEFISRFHTRTYDSLAYVADLSFGSAVSFDVGRLFRAQPVVAAVCTAIYLAPPPALIFVYALQVKRKPHPPVDIVTLLLLSGGLGFALYFLFPVAGPKFAFSGFPESLPALAPLVGSAIEIPPAPRNAVPSLHFMSALMAWTWARRYGRIASTTALVFVVGTFLATMGLGEHYLFDLIVAMPFAIAVQGALVPALPAARRALAIVPSTALYATWLWLAHGDLLLRVPGLSWGMLVATVAAYAVGERMVAEHVTDAVRASSAAPRGKRLHEPPAVNTAFPES